MRNGDERSAEALRWMTLNKRLRRPPVPNTARGRCGPGDAGLGCPPSPAGSTIVNDGKAMPRITTTHALAHDPAAAEQDMSLTEEAHSPAWAEEVSI